MKRIICLVLMAAMILTVLPAMADTERTSGLYTYTIKGNGTITVTGFDWNANGNADIYIPNMIDCYTVTAIGDEAFKCNAMRRSGYSYSWTRGNNFDKITMTIPDSIKSIGKKHSGMPRFLPSTCRTVCRASAMALL